MYVRQMGVEDWKTFHFQFIGEYSFSKFQRDEAKCPALPNACTCTQDSVGPPGPPGPAVRKLQ